MCILIFVFSVISCGKKIFGLFFGPFIGRGILNDQGQRSPLKHLASLLAFALGNTCLFR